MEKSVRESSFVLLVCTPNFARKADAGVGGVGYEKAIVTGEIFAGEARETKFVPLLREGDAKESLPSYLKSRLLIDFREDGLFEAKLEELLRHFHGEPLYPLPPIGTKPDWTKPKVSKRTQKLPPQQIIKNSIGMKFVLNPSGSFTMGSPPWGAERSDDEKQHEVTISKPFYLQSTVVTQSQWQEVMGDNPSEFKDCGDDCPVENVSWNDAQGFIKKLNEIEGVDNYRLPTEAEWEYACRAETNTEFSFGDEASELGEYAWYIDNSGDRTHPVGTKKPNAWGLYDMHGNVIEWCQDWYADYPSNSVTDPKGPSKGEYRVLRGGSWLINARRIRSADRFRNDPNYRYLGIGFRVARDF
jgi:formylglycine-generating enzyme required for sulfatase activity